jgi:hypothetical protein
MGSGSEDGGKTVSGEVKTAEERKAEEKRIAIREQNRMSIAGAIFSRLSRVPFVNVWLHKKVETSRKVVKEEKGLFDDLFDHDKSFRRLENSDMFLREDDALAEAKALAAERELAEERRKAAARETDDEIFRDDKEFEAKKSRMKKEYELRKIEANYKIEMHPLDKAVEKLEKPEQESQKKKTTRGRSEKQKRREEVLKKHEREIKRIEGMKETAKTKSTLIKAAEAEKEKALEEIEKEP